MASIHITDIESAINHWRGTSPSPDGFTLGTELHALAAVYADMALHRCHEIDESKLPPEALQAWLVWYHSTPDTPCIAICSTRAAAAVLLKCSIGPPWHRQKSAPPGGASPPRPAPGVLPNMLSEQLKVWVLQHNPVSYVELIKIWLQAFWDKRYQLLFM